ncbi:MAG: CRISPR-associated helicase/endonuclease Cas3, partial [candidate division WOR-3 bacterium]
EIFSECSQKPSKGKRKKDGDKEDDWVKNLNIQEFEISEYEKYKIVSLFYKSLPEDGSYLSEFYRTLEVLSAGYMSNKKTEAEEIFREIYDIQIIPEELIPEGKLNESKKEKKNFVDEFIKDVKKFDYDKKNFTDFKKEILSRYVISVPYFNISEKNWVFYKVQENLSDKEKLIKLKRWLSRIFISKEHKYDEEKGIIKIGKSEELSII